MTISRIARLARSAGMLAVLAGLFVISYLHSPEAAAAGRSITATVTLSPEVAEKAAPEDVVFIYARAVKGPRMPLAIARKQVKDLPVTVVLDDSQAMSPHMKLSTMPEVMVVARVSKTGLAEARDGDLEGVSPPLSKDAKTVSVSIAKVLTGQKPPPTPQSYR